MTKVQKRLLQYLNESAKLYVPASEIDRYKSLFTGDVQPLEEYIEPITFTEGQMATIILPTEPEASKGKYYRLDRVEEGKIIFEQELQPRAHVPYIIVPDEDFSIDLNALDLQGCYRDTVSVEAFPLSVLSSARRSITRRVSTSTLSTRRLIADSTSLVSSEPCEPICLSVGTTRTIRAGQRCRLRMSLKSYCMTSEQESSQFKTQNEVFDLSGRKVVNRRLPQGVYIENRQKFLFK